MVEFDVSRIEELEELDPLRYEQALRELDSEGVEGMEGIVFCRAFDGPDFEVGHLIIDGAGKIIAVEVVAERRREGIATRMLTALREAGYQIEHDWDNMRDDGAAWVASHETYGRESGASD